MEKQVTVNEKTYTVKEIKYKDLASLGDAPKEEVAKKMMILSAGLSDEEYDDLPMKAGISLQKAINELNGLEDFQNPPAK